MKKKRWLLRAVLTVLLILLGLPIIALGVVYHQRTEVQELVGVLSDIEPGVSAAVAARRSLARFSSAREPNVCVGEEANSCDQYRFSNDFLALLHLSPARWVWITVDYRNGRVVSKSFQFADSSRSNAVVREYSIDDDGDLPAGTEPVRHIVDQSVGPGVYIVKVYDSTSVDLAQRQRDWTINVACLSAIGTCGNLHQILQGAFAQ